MTQVQHKSVNVVHFNCMTRQDTHNSQTSQEFINIRYEPEDDVKTNMQCILAPNFEVESQGEEEELRQS